MTRVHDTNNKGDDVPMSMNAHIPLRGEGQDDDEAARTRRRPNGSMRYNLILKGALVSFLTHP